MIINYSKVAITFYLWENGFMMWVWDTSIEYQIYDRKNGAIIMPLAILHQQGRTLGTH